MVSVVKVLCRIASWLVLEVLGLPLRAMPTAASLVPVLLVTLCITPADRVLDTLLSDVMSIGFDVRHRLPVLEPRARFYYVVLVRTSLSAITVLISRGPWDCPRGGGGTLLPLTILALLSRILITGTPRLYLG